MKEMNEGKYRISRLACKNHRKHQINETFGLIISYLEELLNVNYKFQAQIHLRKIFYHEYELIISQEFTFTYYPSIYNKALVSLKQKHTRSHLLKMILWHEINYGALNFTNTINIYSIGFCITGVLINGQDRRKYLKGFLCIDDIDDSLRYGFGYSKIK